MEQIWVCQNSYGFRAIWTQIFFQSKIYLNRSSAQKSHQKSLKSCLRTLYDVMNDMAEEFFFCQNSYGNTTPFNFFNAQKKYSVTGSGTFGRTDQKLFRYDQRTSDMILWKRGNFGESKLLWAYNGLKFCLEWFFRLRESRSKIDLKWLWIR